MTSAGSRQPLPSKYDDLWKRKLVAGNKDGETSSGDSEDNDWVPLGHSIRKTKFDQGDCDDSRGSGTPPGAPAQPPARIRFDIKPKDPPAYHGKATEDVEVWSQ